MIINKTSKIHKCITTKCPKENIKQEKEYEIFQGRRKSTMPKLCVSFQRVGKWVASCRIKVALVPKRMLYEAISD